MPGSAAFAFERFLLHRAGRAPAGWWSSVTTGLVNDATLAARAAALGVDAVTTDRPAALHDELAGVSLAA